MCAHSRCACFAPSVNRTFTQKCCNSSYIYEAPTGWLVDKVNDEHTFPVSLHQPSQDCDELELSRIGRLGRRLATPKTSQNGLEKQTQQQRTSPAMRELFFPRTSKGFTPPWVYHPSVRSVSDKGNAKLISFISAVALTVYSGSETDFKQLLLCFRLSR